MSTDGDDLPAVLEELSHTLDDLQREFDPGPTGVGGLLRFTEQYTIPAIISILRTNVRLLELLAGAIRLADGRLEETTVPGPGPSRGDRAASTALGTVDRALTDLSEAAAGTPTDPEARRLLDRARDLRDEASERVENQSRGLGESRSRAAKEGRHREEGVRRGRNTDERRPEDETGTGSGGIEIDVEEELDDIRREVDDDEE